METPPSGARECWSRLLVADVEYLHAWADVMQCPDDLTAQVGASLRVHEETSTALAYLSRAPESAIRPHIVQLFELLSVVHVDLGAVNDVMRRVDSAWLLQNLDSAIEGIIASRDPSKLHMLLAYFHAFEERALLAASIERARHRDDTVFRAVCDRYDFGSNDRAIQGLGGAGT